MARRLLVLIVGVIVVAGCSDDGRELRPPRPDQTLSITTVPTIAPTTTAPSTTTATAATTATTATAALTTPTTVGIPTTPASG